MKRLVLFSFLLFFLSTRFKTGKPAWRLFTKDGKPVRYAIMVRRIQEADIVLFGEHHNNPIVHWLQLELSYDLMEARDSNLIFGAEMFESDNQLILDEYLQGMISTTRFEAEARL